jgi:hypothetical protein
VPLGTEPASKAPAGPGPQLRLTSGQRCGLFSYTRGLTLKAFLILGTPAGWRRSRAALTRRPAGHLAAAVHPAGLAATRLTWQQVPALVHDRLRAPHPRPQRAVLRRCRHPLQPSTAGGVSTGAALGALARPGARGASPPASCRPAPPSCRACGRGMSAHTALLQHQAHGHWLEGARGDALRARGGRTQVRMHALVGGKLKMQPFQHCRHGRNMRGSHRCRCATSLPACDWRTSRATRWNWAVAGPRGVSSVVTRPAPVKACRRKSQAWRTLSTRGPPRESGT